MKEGKVVCKVRLVAQGFEEYNKKLEREAPTCAPETLKLCIAKIIQEGWVVKSIDVKTAYLQGDNRKGGISETTGGSKYRQDMEAKEDGVRAERRHSGMVQECGGVCAGLGRSQE